MKRRRIILQVMCGLCLVSLILNLSCTGGQPAEKSKDQTVQENSPGGEDGKNVGLTDAVPVQVISPLRGDISSYMLFSSNVDSEKVVDIYPMTSGIITKINFDEGDKVRKNATLAVLDDREASIKEAKARIRFEQLKMEFSRKEEIYNKRLISKEEFEKLRFSLETARLDWDENRLMLEYTRIKSPISGVVTRRNIKEGNKIATNQMAFSVIEDREKIVVVNIPEQERADIYLKQPVVISADQGEVSGEVLRISPAIDPENGTFKVTVEVRDRERLFAVGQFVNVKIIRKVHQDVILLNKDALVFEGGKVFAFLVDSEDRAQKKEIALGFDDGKQVEVMTGISLNDRVVTAGKSSLKHQAKVRVVEPVLK